MNPEFVAAFTAVSADLLTVWGAEALHTAVATSDESTVRIVLETELVAVGEVGERMEPRPTLEVLASTGAVVGDTFTVAGTVTVDDPLPDDVVWTAVQLISDDGYTRKFAVRNDV